VKQLEEAISTLQESTKQNLIRKKEKKDELLECY